MCNRLKLIPVTQQIVYAKPIVARKRQSEKQDERPHYFRVRFAHIEVHAKDESSTEVV